MVMQRVITFLANTLTAKQADPKMAPHIVTFLHPYLFTKALEIGPVEIETR
jgi:hypothetical protein